MTSESHAIINQWQLLYHFFTPRGLWDIWGAGAFLWHQDKETHVTNLVMHGETSLLTHRSRFQQVNTIQWTHQWERRSFETGFSIWISSTHLAATRALAFWMVSITPRCCSVFRVKHSVPRPTVLCHVASLSLIRSWGTHCQLVTQNTFFCTNWQCHIVRFF